MNEQELKNQWLSYDKKLDQLLSINFEQLKALRSDKAQSHIRSFTKNHIAVMIFGILWVLLLGFLFYHGRDNVFFAISIGSILLFNVFAVALYLKHIIILTSIDIAESITQTQEKLVQVYTSYTQTGRVLLLQTPFFCTWWYSEELVQNAGLTFWTINLSVVAIFTTLSIYLFRKFSLKNTSEKWVQRTDKFFGAEKLKKSIAFLKEIEEFKKDR